MKKFYLLALFVFFLVPVRVASAGPKFIQDDYVRARAQAKQRNVPLFVEVWAPW